MTDGGGSARRAPVVTVAAAALTALVLLVAVWAATIGPDDPLRGAGPVGDRSSVPPPPLEDPPATDDDGTRQPGQDPEKVTWITTVLGITVLTIGVGVALALLYLAVVGVRRASQARWEARRRDRPPPELDPVQAVAAAMVADADDQEELLTSGTPRNAVVQSWHCFEVQAERAGVPRHPWETSAEFTLRLLDLVEADAGSVARLAALYREARFSEHELGEDARAVALEVLRSIHRDLRSLLSGGRV